MRRVAEGVLRAAVLASLALMLRQSLRSGAAETGATIRSRGIGGDVLTSWSRASRPPHTIAIHLATLPNSEQRAWLGALAGAGSTIKWNGDLPPIMIDAQPLAAPTGGTKVSVASAKGSLAELTDRIGRIDTVRLVGGGASVTLGAGTDSIAARVGGSSASTLLRDSVVLRKVLVIGSAGWESKFVVAALEEEGWKVDALIRLAPGVDVTQGPPVAIDTAHYSAVVAIDSTAAPYANRIVEYARNGGGVILEPSAAALDAMSPLRSGNASRGSSDSNADAGDAITLSTLPLGPIISLRPDAVTLEKRGATTAVAAVRIAAGRSLQLGYSDTWLWRMNGGDAGVADHRKWWTRLVSSVAFAPRVPRASVRTSAAETKNGAAAASAGDPAPYADMIATIGIGTSIGLMLRGESSRSTVWLFVVFAAALVGEIASRRTRGAG
jgi:hypothetical protein